jgi:hypothetical protein
VGVLNGALGGSTGNQVNRITRGINQAFSQSSYLRAGGGTP